MATVFPLLRLLSKSLRTLATQTEPSVCEPYVMLHICVSMFMYIYMWEGIKYSRMAGQQVVYKPIIYPGPAGILQKQTRRPGEEWKTLPGMRGLWKMKREVGDTV